MTTQRFLEIDLHLINGRTHKFIQNDPVQARRILQQISPKIFAQPSLVITGYNQSAAYAGATLIGISLLMERIPEELLDSGPLPALPLEITQAEYQARQSAMPAVGEGSPPASVLEIEFTSGRRLWLEFPLPATTSGLQERHLLHNLFSMPGLLCRRLGGGVSLWNGMQVASCSFAPELDAPSNAWAAELVR